MATYRRVDEVVATSGIEDKVVATIIRNRG